MSTPARSSPRAATALSARARIRGGGLTRLRRAPSAAFVRHSPGRARAFDRADDAVSGHHDAEVTAGGLDERLHDGAVPAEPAAPPKPFEPGPQLALITTDVDLSPPAAKPRLHHVRSWKPWNRHLADMCRSRLADTGPPEEERGRELVVGRQESERAVHHLHPTTLQLREPPKSPLDSVERRQDVQPRDHHIVFRQARRRGALRERHAVPKAGESCDESAIRFRRFAHDDDRAQAIRTSRRSRCRALAGLDVHFDLCNCHRASSAPATKVSVRAR
jgi:hypothetical protein